MKKILIIIILFLFSFIPTRDGLIYHSCNNFLLNQDYYINCYNEKYKVPNWVSYKLTKEMILSKDTLVEKNFKTDTANLDISPNPNDYYRSGYDRGHMVSAEDMNWSYEASKKTYVMTNVSPQHPSFNRGLFLRAENQVRKWAVENEEIYITTGTIFDKEHLTINNGEIHVPTYFYKIILDYKGPDKKMIAFIFKNEKNDLPLINFVCSVDSLEKVTGYDFYSSLPDDIENKLESSKNTSSWIF